MLTAALEVAEGAPVIADLFRARDALAADKAKSADFADLRFAELTRVNP